MFLFPVLISLYQNSPPDKCIAILFTADKALRWLCDAYSEMPLLECQPLSSKSPFTLKMLLYHPAASTALPDVRSLCPVSKHVILGLSPFWQSQVHHL